jgi:peptidoglycan/LPS O-acetylase OafA/YrhL
MSPSYYRPDIDGLRALAVAPVILFHSKLGCPGGFVGVDIFFVISGYLISSIILKEIDAGTFSLVTFWERRVRPILPALTIVVLAAFLAGACIYLPDDFLVLGKSIIAQAALCSNLFFYLQPNGYFDASPEIHPLLHTWSLAVEEQFYLLFPLLLLFLSKRSGLFVTKSLAALLMLSLVWSIFSTPYFPRASFYLIPARAWELLLGALLANCRSHLPTGRAGAEILGAIGLAGVGPKPGLYATTASPRIPQTLYCSISKAHFTPAWPICETFTCT